MPEAAANTYKVDRRAIDFTLYEHLHVRAALRARALRAPLARGVRRGHRAVRALRDRGDRTAQRAGRSRRLPASRTARSHTPAGLQGRLEEALRARPGVVRHAARRGRLRRPARRSRSILQELQSGANTAFNMYPGLTHGAADVIQHFALPEDKERFLPHMMAGRFAGTMCLSEPHAGLRRRRHQDPGQAARRQPLRDQRHQVLDLGRRPRPGREHHPPRAGAHRGRAGGHQGPVALHRAEGLGERRRQRSGEPNDVVTGSIEHKLGIKASATAVLNFGENGELPRHPRRRPAAPGHEADVPHDERRAHRRRRAGRRGGVDGVPERARATRASASRARRCATSRTRTRRASPIIEHADVRRMLLEMKAKVEGMRTLAVKLALHADLAHALEKDDPAQGAATTRARSIC